MAQRTVIVGQAEFQGEVGRALSDAGVCGRYITAGDAVGYEYVVPSERGLLRVRSWARTPSEVGFGKRFRRRMRKMKRKLKKVVKNKAFRALAKVALQAGKMIPGAGNILSAAESAAMAAKAIKGGVKAAKALKRGGIKAASRALSREAARLAARRLGG
jgi:hypothetical protein